MQVHEKIQIHTKDSINFFQGKSAKKARAATVNEENDLLNKAPHSFVFHRGKVGICVLELIRDIRRLMEPFTASRLKVIQSNCRSVKL